MEDDIFQERITKLNSLIQKGIKPFGARLEGVSLISGILSNFKENTSVLVAGRLSSKREHGKVIFIDIRDSSAKIQAYIREDTLGKEGFELFGLLDIGDILAVKGELFKTRTNEPTVKALSITLLSKSLRPLPEKWHGLKDVEVRYRKRHLDLIANPEVKDIFVKRSRIISGIRSHLDAKGYIEVETPMMHPIPGGAAGRPFKTHHNEYAMDLYLRIAPELYLKRLLVGGFERVYEINRSFRNEGVSTRHNPEFTMLEVYTAYADYESVMSLTEEIIVKAASALGGSLKFEYQGKVIDLTLPWKRRSFADVVKDKFGISPEDSAGQMLDKLKARGRDFAGKRLSRSQIVRIVEEELQEGDDFSPVFFTDYFSILCPLAKNKTGNPHISERFELFIGGMEVANAYTELNDPIEQRRRLQEELKDLPDEEKEKRGIDEDFINALEYGLPPAGGLGIGIDRLVMILTNQPSIRDVILFPLLRQE